VHIQPAAKTASVSLTVDGQTYEYRNGPEEWHSFQWPGAGNSPGAVLRVRSNKGVVETLQQEGEWGLFRLFEEASVRASNGARVFTLVWRIPSLDTEVAIDIRPARGDSPFVGGVKGQKAQLLMPFRAPGVTPPPDLGHGAGCPES
jgi:type VI secretion system protein ImpL